MDITKRTKLEFFREWAKALTTPAPGVAATNKYAGMSVNAAYNLGALEPMRKDMQYLGSVFKDERTVQAVKDGKGETKDFVNDMNMMYQLSQATPEEKKKLQKAGPEDVKKALKKYPSFAPLTSQLLGSYMEEGVVLDLPAIAEEFEELASKVMREVKVEIVSAAAGVTAKTGAGTCLANQPADPSLFLIDTLWQHEPWP
eukprot:1206014-Amorphochlora_amoeboformis.AAC.2